ncbi:hypothetical protein BV898_15129 [Hypsibius exemplaris]|uniref:G-protein coupled receptors family 1 profile domain-containing protein n=1 Tax=Hypsibius exemplaris TaxID=2072580 RepID=A0A9X6NDF5_HYPEX|nr:hypothetical protein BV898_15129 [Hypsibius exemplaris]
MLPSIIFGTVITAAQLFNLVVFAFWRHKEPSTVTLIRLFGAVFPLYTITTGILANVLISIDRWLSVEFAFKYRTVISRKKTLWAIVVVIFGASLLLVGPVYVVHWNDIIVLNCAKPYYFSPGTSVGILVWRVANGPIYMLVLFVCQLRMLMIAISHGLQRRRNRLRARRRLSSLAPVPQSRLVTTLNETLGSRVRIVWSSVMASMAVVCFTMLANIPAMVGFFLQNSISTETRYAMMVLNLSQHCMSPVLYLLFWRQFRRILFPCCGRLQVVVVPVPRPRYERA